MKKVRGEIAEVGRRPTHRKERDEWGTRLLQASEAGTFAQVQSELDSASYSGILRSPDRNS